MTHKNARLTKFTIRLQERLNDLADWRWIHGWVILLTAPLVLLSLLVDGPDDYDRDYDFRGRAVAVPIVEKPHSHLFSFARAVIGEEIPLIALALILLPPTWVAGKLGLIEY